MNKNIPIIQNILKKENRYELALKLENSYYEVCTGWNDFSAINIFVNYQNYLYLNDLKDEENKYLKSIYESLKAKEKNQNLSQEEFLNIFKSKDIKYVMGITSHLKNKPLQEMIDKYTSNIAKLSLIQCYQEMRTEYYDLSFEIIKNDACFLSA